MIFSSSTVRTNATKATCTRSFQERVLSFPDLNLSCFYTFILNVFIFNGKVESPVTQITVTMVTIATSRWGELGTGVTLALLEQNKSIRIFLP